MSERERKKNLKSKVATPLEIQSGLQTHSFSLNYFFAKVLSPTGLEAAVHVATSFVVELESYFYTDAPFLQDQHVSPINRHLSLKIHNVKFDINVPLVK